MRSAFASFKLSALAASSSSASQISSALLASLALLLSYSIPFSTILGLIQSSTSYVDLGIPCGVPVVGFVGGVFFGVFALGFGGEKAEWRTE